MTSGFGALHVVLLIVGIITLNASMLMGAFGRTREHGRDAATLAILAVAFGVLSLAAQGAPG